MKGTIKLQIPIERTARVRQTEGIFDLSSSDLSVTNFDYYLPIEEKFWNVGLIVGRSGTGKSSLARQLFKETLVNFQWSSSKSIIDDFPASLGIRDIVHLLSSVGFSSPPNWLRPFDYLSTGEQMRVVIARAITEVKDPIVIDEFTSVVDRTVAQIGSAALAKVIRKRNRKFIAISCHYDIIEWLQPDWIFCTDDYRFQWRSLQRFPEITFQIIRTDYTTWDIFRRYHYLNHTINKASLCFVALYKDRPVAFCAVLNFPHFAGARWREHRTVCLPDYQGIGIGNKLSEQIAAAFRGTGRRFISTTTNPSMIWHRAKSPLWKMISGPRFRPQHSNQKASSGFRKTASFEFFGKSDPETARKFGLI